MRHMVTKVVMALVMLAWACTEGGAVEIAETESGEVEIAQAEQALSFNGNALGVATWNSEGYARCTSGAVVDYCAYPANKQILVKVISNTFGDEELANVHDALGNVLATINQQFGAAGWSAFKTTSASADVLLRNDSNAGSSASFGLIPSVLKTVCLSAGGLLAENPSIPLTHRRCAQWDGRLDMAAINEYAQTKPAGELLAWRYSSTAHAVAQAVLRPMGLGYVTGTTTGYTRYSLEPMNTAAGFLPAEHCSIQSFSTSPAGGITRLSGCP